MIEYYIFIGLGRTLSDRGQFCIVTRSPVQCWLSTGRHSNFLSLYWNPKLGQRVSETFFGIWKLLVTSVQSRKLFSSGISISKISLFWCFRCKVSSLLGKVSSLHALWWILEKVSAALLKVCLTFFGVCKVGPKKVPKFRPQVCKVWVPTGCLPVVLAHLCTFMYF